MHNCLCRCIRVTPIIVATPCAPVYYLYVSCMPLNACFICRFCRFSYWHKCRFCRFPYCKKYWKSIFLCLQSALLYVTHMFYVCHSPNLSFVGSVSSRIDVNISFVGSRTAKNVENPLSYVYNTHSCMLHTCFTYDTQQIFHLSVLSVPVLA